MNNRKILILGGNNDQLPYISEIFQRGYRIYLIDKNKNAPGKKYAKEFFNIGYDNIEGIIKLSKNINLIKSDRIFTAASQFAHLSGSQVANIFNIPYPKKKVIEMCLNKIKFYDAFINCGLHVPKYVKIKNFLELKKFLIKNNFKNYYLKSDMSKNPKYVYKINKDNFLTRNIFWGKDRYLQRLYILQEEFKGENLRVNFYKDDYLVFDFFLNKLADKKKRAILEKLNIISKLKNFLAVNGLLKWLIKFDIIISGSNWCVIDVGLDPPMRMKHLYETKGLNFASYYVDQYVENKISYAKI